MKVKPLIPLAVRAQLHDVVGAIQNIKPYFGRLEGVNLDIIRKSTGLNMISRDKFSVKNKEREVFFSFNNSYSYRIQEQRNNDATDVFIKNDYIEEYSGITDTKTELENFIQNACKLLDLPLLQLRKLLAGQKIGTYTLPGQMDRSQLEIVKEIESLFQQIETNLKSVKNASSRAYIKKGYPAIQKDAQLLKRYDFAGIGDMGENYSIQILNDRRSKQNIVIRITDKNNETKNIIIEPNGKVLKEKNITSRCNLGGRSTYYTQYEIDSFKFKHYLDILKTELSKYNNYIIERIAKSQDFKHQNSTDSIGIIDDLNLKTIKEIHKKFDKLRMALYKLKDKKKKESAKEKLEISTYPGDSTILFKGDENIRLGFPPLKGKDSVKILVLDKKRNIVRSFCIQDSNLIKFNPTSLHRGKRNDTINHYHTQQEIEESHLDEYLSLLNNRLNNIIKIISQGELWYK